MILANELPVFAISLIVIAILLFVMACIFIPFFIVRKIYTDFVIKHSIALKQLDAINYRYQFRTICNYDMEHCYDNENFYGDITCQDYLTYQLVDMQDDVYDEIENTAKNRILFAKYKKEIDETVKMNQFDTDNVLKNSHRLSIYEKIIFEKRMLKPITIFTINVRLILTNIYGRYRCSKSHTFSQNDIQEIIYRINQKRGNFYLNEDIWYSISRVERGKVTNKVRFRVYERDGYRCRKCGRTNDLEIDHIIPISKGGKSTLDNLQTLCHSCNCYKGSNIE